MLVILAQYVFSLVAPIVLASMQVLTEEFCYEVSTTMATMTNATPTVAVTNPMRLPTPQPWPFQLTWAFGL